MKSSEEFQHLKMKLKKLNKFQVDHDALVEFHDQLQENRENVEIYACQVDIILEAINLKILSLEADMIRKNSETFRPIFRNWPDGEKISSLV